MAIAALVLWVLTAGAGLLLFISGNGAKRAAARHAAPVPAPSVTAPAVTVSPGTAGPPEPPPIPRVKVHATPGEHPLLEFSHPALALIGMGLWFVFVGTRHAPLAWASFGSLVAAIVAGLSWLARSTLAARRGERPARAGFPPRLILLHGLAATATVALAVLTALSASHI